MLNYFFRPPQPSTPGEAYLPPDGKTPPPAQPGKPAPPPLPGKTPSQPSKPVVVKDTGISPPAQKPPTKAPFKGKSYVPIPRVTTEPPPPGPTRTYSYGRVTYSPYTYRHIEGTPGTYTYRSTTTGTTTTTPKYFDKIPVEPLVYRL
jgi:hypothetical protein